MLYVLFIFDETTRLQLADLPYLEACGVLKLNEKWITVECTVGDEDKWQDLEFWVTILNSDGEKFMQSFPESVFNVTHFQDSGLLWLQIQAKGGEHQKSNTIHIEINFEKEADNENPWENNAPIITGTVIEFQRFCKYKDFAQICAKNEYWPNQLKFGLGKR